MEMAASWSHVVGYLVPRSEEVPVPQTAMPAPAPAPAPAPRNWRIIRPLSRYFVVIALAVFIITGMMALYAAPDHGNDIWGSEISLENFSVSNLSITGAGQISGNWSIELGLKNPNHRTRLLYTNVKYTVVYSGAPDAPIIDSEGLGFPLLQPPKNRTTVSLNGSPENVRLSQLTAASMARDVIDNGAVEFDLVTVALIVGNSNHNSDPGGETQLVLACNGIKVLISPSKSADPAMNVTGCASQIPVCDLASLIDE